MHEIIVENPGFIVKCFSIWFEKHHAAPTVYVASLSNEVVSVCRVLDQTLVFNIPQPLI
jgi:hypothetical protein